MTIAVGLLNASPATILETGTSCRGTDSTRLFDSYVRSFGGEFWSVDIDPEVVNEVRSEVGARTELRCDDSVSFLSRWARENHGERADLVYLDSFDVDFADPWPAAEHCLDEFEAIRLALQPGSLLLIDDSPGDIDYVPEQFREGAQTVYDEYGVFPGKGMLVETRLAELGVEKLHHWYQALYRF
jgi:hypothetical protein